MTAISESWIALVRSIGPGSDDCCGIPRCGCQWDLAVHSQSAYSQDGPIAELRRLSMGRGRLFFGGPQLWARSGP